MLQRDISANSFLQNFALFTIRIFQRPMFFCFSPHTFFTFLQIVQSVTSVDLNDDIFYIINYHCSSVVRNIITFNFKFCTAILSVDG